MNYTLMQAPLYINWNISYDCNFNCEHCFSRPRVRDELNYDGKIKVAENIIRNKVFVVNLGGGEPLLSPDLFDVIDALSKNRVRVNISTNGWELSGHTLSRLAENGLGGVNISVDNANPEEHDAFRNKPGSLKNALSSALKYKTAGISVYFSTVITQKNFTQLSRILDLAVAYHCDGVRFKRLKLSGNALGKEELALNREQEKQLYGNIAIWKENYDIPIGFIYDEEPVGGIDAGCPCGKTSLCILDNGDIAPCVVSNPVIIGNALRHNLGDIWRNSPELNRLRDDKACGVLKREEKGQGVYR